MNESRIDLIESSFTKLKKNKEQFSEHFYKRLFAKSPQVEPLFAHTTMKSQGAKLYAALVLLVENLRHPDELKRVLEPLGSRHLGYGIIAEHYQLFSENILETMKVFLEDDWTPELEQAWAITLDDVIETMLATTCSVTQGPKAPKKIVVPASQRAKIEHISIELVESSFEKLKPIKEEFALGFYEKLFHTYPQLKPLFAHIKIEKQARKLYGALVLLVENIRQPEALERVLLPLGERHKDYGTLDEHYPMLKVILLGRMKECLPDDWTPSVEEAWSQTYDVVSEIMMRGTHAPSGNRRKGNREAQQADIAENKSTKHQKTAGLTRQQETQKSKKKTIFSPIVNWFWETSQWKIALLATILFVLFIPLGRIFPTIKEFIDLLEPLSIILAVLLFVKESPERKKQFHYQAWTIIDGANGIKNSRARIIALQDLCDDGISLKGLELQGAELSNIELNGADLSDVNLFGASLNNAELYLTDLNNADLSNANCTGIILSKANLGFAKLYKAKCSSGDFSEANLMFSDMREGNFSGADFSNAKLKGTKFDGAYFSGANLKGAEVSIDDLEKAYLVKTIMPDGSIHE